jgi:hypothetical protein
LGILGIIFLCTGVEPFCNMQVICVTPLPENEVVYVAKKKDLTIDERIKKEERRLKRIYKNIDKDNKAIIDGLIKRAAYMLVTLEDWEKDIGENGYYEMFTQSLNTPPYERERPVARLYNTMNKNYQSIIKQLSDLVPKPDTKKEKDDGFDAFISERDD